MEIKLDNKYILSSDGQNFTIVENKIVQSGKNQGSETSEIIGYYTSLESALHGYLRIQTLNSKAASFKELIDEVKNYKKTITLLFK